jgi:hypothetical protein
MVRISVFAVVMTLLGALSAEAQTYRLRGMVRDDSGKPVEGARVRAEAFAGFMGQPFGGGQRTFEVKTNAKGEFTIAGLTSGGWVFEASAPNTIPNVIVLPVHFTQRPTASSQMGGSLSWNLPMQVRRSSNEKLGALAAAALEKRSNDFLKGLPEVMAESDPDVVCASGELAIIAKQQGYAAGVFDQIVKKDAKSPCGTLGLAGASLMLNNFDQAYKMYWVANDIVAKDQRQAIGAAVKDLTQIANVK